MNNLQTLKPGQEVLMNLRELRACAEAELLPMMEPDDFDYRALCDSIQTRMKSGMEPFAEPMAITVNGRLANGRHRRRAGLALGVEQARCVVKSQEEVKRIVLDTTLARRHFTQSQRAVLVCKLRPDVFASAAARRGGDKSNVENSTLPSIVALADQFHVGRDYLYWAWRLCSHPSAEAARMAERVLSGAIKLNAAVRGLPSEETGDGGVARKGKVLKRQPLKIWKKTVRAWSHNLRFFKSMEEDERSGVLAEVRRGIAAVRAEHIPHAEEMVAAMRAGLKEAKEKAGAR